eukprot:4251374-Karenia_brevis.AAC.1
MSLGTFCDGHITGTGANKEVEDLACGPDRSCGAPCRMHVKDLGRESVYDFAGVFKTPTTILFFMPMSCGRWKSSKRPRPALSLMNGVEGDRCRT